MYLIYSSINIIIQYTVFMNIVEAIKFNIKNDFLQYGLAHVLNYTNLYMYFKYGTKCNFLINLMKT